MATWIYESHMGGLFAMPRPLSVDECYCDQCGDYDWEIGRFETMADFVSVYADDIALNEYDGGYDIDYIIESVGADFDDKLTHEQIKEIVSTNKTHEDADDDTLAQHGHWYRTGREDECDRIEIECSECGYTHMANHNFNEEELWCFHCGAKMEEDKDG